MWGGNGLAGHVRPASSVPEQCHGDSRGHGHVPLVGTGPSRRTCSKAPVDPAALPCPLGRTRGPSLACRTRRSETVRREDPASWCLRRLRSALATCDFPSFALGVDGGTVGGVWGVMIMGLFQVLGPWKLARRGRGGTFFRCEEGGCIPNALQPSLCAPRFHTAGTGGGTRVWTRWELWARGVRGAGWAALGFQASPAC